MLFRLHVQRQLNLNRLYNKQNNTNKIHIKSAIYFQLWTHAGERVNTKDLRHMKLATANSYEFCCDFALSIIHYKKEIQATPFSTSDCFFFISDPSSALFLTKYEKWYKKKHFSCNNKPTVLVHEITYL